MRRFGPRQLGRTSRAGREGGAGRLEWGGPGDFRRVHASGGRAGEGGRNGRGGRCGPGELDHVVRAGRGGPIRLGGWARRTVPSESGCAGWVRSGTA